MRHHAARRRDDCEKAIIDALRAVGASVLQHKGKGEPDLLVGRRVLVLMECKDPVAGTRNSRAKGKRPTNATALRLGIREEQGLWWDAWRGPAPVVVTTPAEAIAALERAEGAVTVVQSAAPAVDLDDIPF